MTVAMANPSGTANTHPSRGRSQGGLNPTPAPQPKSGGLLRSVSGVFKRDKSAGGSSRARRAAQNEFTNKESRDAALRAYGLLPQPDMSALEKQRDKVMPPSPDPNQAHTRADSVSTTERIKQEYKSKDVDSKSRMQDFKFGGGPSGTSPRQPPPGIEPISEDSPSRWRAQKEDGPAAEAIFPRRAAPRAASSDNLLDEAIGQAISTPMQEAVGAGGQAISTPQASPKPPPSPSRDMKAERRRGRPSYPAPGYALPLPPPSTGLDIADSLTDSLSRHKASPNPSIGGESPKPPSSSLPSHSELESSPEVSASPVTPPSAHTTPALDQAATHSPAEQQDDGAFDVILDAYDYGDGEDAPVAQGSVDIKRNWSRATRGKPGVPLPDVPPPAPEGGGVRRRKTLNPFRRGDDGDAPSSGGKFSRSKSLMRPRGEGRRARTRNRSVDESRERTAVAPTMHKQGTVMQDVHRIKDDESRQLTEMAFM